MKKRVILDTDIGTDIDDAYALSFLLSSPDVQLEGICTVHGAVEQRARLARKLLRMAGRQDIPVIVGLAGGGDPAAMPNQAPWAADTEIAMCARDPVAFVADRLAASPGQIHLLAIGPLTNVGALFRAHPQAARQAAGLVIMGGSVYKGYSRRDAPEAEYNIRCDPAAARVVMKSGADIALVPLDVTMTTRLSDEQLKMIGDSQLPLAKAMTALLPLWRQGKTHNPILHDPLAAALLLDASLGTMRAMHIEVADDGMTLPVEDGRTNARVCLEVNAARFLELFMSRLTGPPGR